MLSGAKVLLLARVFKLGQLLKPSACARIQDLSAGSHLWRLLRVFVPFAGSQHHQAALPAHAVHAVLPRRRGTWLQGCKLQSGRMRTVQEHALHEDKSWVDSDHLVHHLEATCGVVNVGGEGERPIPWA